jgi:hypothetical protein
VGKLYANRHYSLKRAPKEMDVPETMLQAWVEADERVSGTAKSMRGTTFVYPAWQLAQIVQAHAYDVPMVGAVSAKATDLGYRVERGREDEDWQVLERGMRRELREQDDLYTLHGKAFDREVERRRKEKNADVMRRAWNINFCGWPTNASKKRGAHRHACNNTEIQKLHQRGSLRDAS